LKKIVPLLLLICISCSDRKNFEFYKNNLPDSLSVYLLLANEDTVSYEKRLDYTNKAYKILTTQNNDSINRKNLFKVANRYYNIENFDKYKNVSAEIIKKAIAEKDTLNTAKAYTYLGDYYSNSTDRTEKDSAYYYYKKAEKIYLKLNNKINLANTYISIATIHAYENDFSGSELSAIKALNTIRDIDNVESKYEAYNILAIAACELKDYNRAIQYHTKAINIAKKNNLEESEISSLNNIGYVYQCQNRDLQAIKKFKEALKNKSITYRPDLQAILIDNLAYSKFKMNNYSQLPDLFYKALEIRDSLKITSGIIYSKVHLSEFYKKTHDINTAQRFAKEALELSKSTKNYRAYLVSLKQIGIVEPQKASFYSNEYIRINDSLQQAERKSKDKFARISFETDEYIIQNDKLTEQNRKIMFSGIIVVLFGTLIFVIKSQQSKNRELLLKQEQQKASEEIYQLILDQQMQFNEGREREKKRIAKELHDGIMNKLAGIRFNLFILEKKTDPETTLKCMTYISEIQSIEKEIRNIAHDLHQDVFDTNNDYAELIKSLVNSLDEITELKIHLEMDTKVEWETIPAVIKMHVYRILQESINNSIKHSHAEIITVTIIEQHKILTLEIKDDGYGFNTQQESVSMGIKNIKSRTAEIKGNCKIDSSQKGTSILITIPLEI